METNKQIDSFSFKIRMVLTKVVQWIRWKKYTLQGYDIDRLAQMERGLNLDRINPQGVHVGAYTIITSRVTIYAHYLYSKNNSGGVTYRGERVDTYIGRNCVIGVGAIILPGVKVGNRCVIGAGAVVSKDVPDNTIVAGNPARVIRSISDDEIRI